MSCLARVKAFPYLSRWSPINKIARRMISEECKPEEDATTNKCTTPQIAIEPCWKPKEEPCAKQGAEVKKKFKSMWEKATCCTICLPRSMPYRHDVNDLEPSEPLSQRTWWECPHRCLVQKVCHVPKCSLPVAERRPRGQGNPDYKWCAKVSECAKIEMFEEPCNICLPKMCRKGRVQKCCQKRCTLYPSYSECCHRRPKPKRPNECGCLSLMGVCALTEYMQRMGFSKDDNKGPGTQRGTKGKKKN